MRQRHDEYRCPGFAQSWQLTCQYLDKFFVKAQQLADSFEAAHGSPDQIIKGVTAVRRNAQGGFDVAALDGRTGVVFMQDCWRTPSEKLANWFGIDDSKSGDHIDPWNGETTETYLDREKSLLLVYKSAQVWFWKAKAA